MLTFSVHAMPAPVALAALPTLPTLVTTAPAGSGTHTSAPAAPRPLPSRDATGHSLAVLPAVPTESRSLDSLPPEPPPEPPPAVVAPDEPVSAELASAVPAATTPAPAPASAVQPSVARPAVVRAAARPARLWRQLRRGLTVKGVATWYYGTRGYAGVAHVAMPGARYLARGRSAPRARVCAGGRCIVVRVVDSCGCHRGTSRARVADLSATTMRRLGLNPARGVYRVRVTLLRP